MELQAFCEKVCGAAREILGEEYLCDVQEVRRNNEVRLQGLVIRRRGRSIAPTVYLDGFYQRYEEGETFAIVLRDVLECFRAGEPEADIDLNYFREYERVRNRICFRLIGADRNTGLLRDIPYIPFLDLAVIFYYAFHEDTIGDGSIRIANCHLREWGIGAEELMKAALANTPRLFPAEAMRMTDVLAVFRGARTGTEPISDPSVILSNRERLNGAAAILYPGELARRAEEAGANLYVIPSSVHEVILCPELEPIPPESLRGIIREVNRTKLALPEILSDSLYIYDRAEERVRIA